MSCHDSPSRSVSTSSVPTDDEVGRGSEYTVARRRQVIAEFFSRHGGHRGAGNGHDEDSRRLGLGRALDDFQEWEIRSGRVDDGAGSPWWSIVNGILVHDLAEAADGGADGPWRDYLASPPLERQSRLWRAHQYSIGRGASAAQDLLAREVPTERAFIEIALGVVESAAAAELDTSRGSLGRRTAQLYPQSYPCCEADLERLLTELRR